MRAATAVLIAVLSLSWFAPRPAFGMSTEKEVAQGTSESGEVDRQSIIVTDPFLTSWVDHIGANLAKFRARTDITYRFEIIDSAEINSFALPGGFVHVDLGLLNFADSDDEVAGVMGHEMGHIERRHVVTLGQKGNILGILIGVLSLLSPIAYALGGYGGDLLFNKFSREDELQADQYGLLLMSRAGYDPRAPVDLFERLAEMEKNAPAESRVDKAFADHPAAKDRVAHLMGYPELDRPSADALLARAIHDESEGQFSYARARLKKVLMLRPTDALAQRHLAELEAALTESGARTDGTVASAALGDPSSVRDIALQLASAANVAGADFEAARDEAKSGNPEIESLFNQLEGLVSTVPDVSGSDGKKNLKVVSDAVDRLTRDINGVLGYASDAFSTGPDLIVDGKATLRDMAAPLGETTLTPKTQALIPYYPAVTAQLARSSDDIVRALQRERAAISMGAARVHLLSDFFNSANAAKRDRSGEISAESMPAVQAAMAAAVGAWDQAGAMAASGSGLMYAAQARGLSAHLTLLDLMSSPDRYAAYQRALAYRFPGVQIPDYRAAAQSGVAPGELACSAWLAFETKQPMSAMLELSRSSDTPCPDEALQRHLFAESMEIAVGLLYADYTNKPQPIKAL